MALHQQLARIPAADLATCRTSVERLHEVCSFDLAPERDHLDMDWWPQDLVTIWALLGVPDGLRHAFDGDDEVNPAYRDRPDSVFVHPVTALEPHRVGEVAEALRAITVEAVRAVVPADRRRAAAVLGEHVSDIRASLPELFAEQHGLLRDFYLDAARRGLAVVLWWD
ncbi:hypothetical protein [Saccharothrix variisporea]|uniref:DUF1877 family protein n=1 Tax=Saccharothrix variisporea TaxID=543527 RepID=A0A495X3C0_9PSEU|nr:hypothetical protein [Saccharothrix variisporea]RKT68490.1 hypothetical protein DFJ66_1675 [Saccharothrix variisporea]